MRGNNFENNRVNSYLEQPFSLAKLHVYHKPTNYYICKVLLNKAFRFCPLTE